MLVPSTRIEPDGKIVLSGGIEVGNWRVSEHFTLWEWIRSDNHPGLVELPTPIELLYLQQFTRNALEPLRDFVGPLRISSGHRGGLLNESVGGVANSVHQINVGGQIIGVAADVVPLSVSAIDVFRLLPDLPGLPIATVIYYPESKFLHLDNRQRENGKRCYMTSSKKKSYVVLTEKEVREYAPKEG